MNNIFNSTFEISLRILLTLYVNEKDMAKDSIVASDFITIYAADFGVGAINLHGVNEFNFSEYAVRREQVSLALKQLFLDEEVTLHTSADGFTYSITDKGVSICDEMTTRYAADYINLAYKTKEFLTNKNTVEIVDILNHYALMPRERNQ